VQGSCPNLRFVLSGTIVTTNDDTKFKRGPCRNVETADSVDVKGWRQRDNSVLATEVNLGKK
jgi:hypothetical protein